MILCLWWVLPVSSEEDQDQRQLLFQTDLKTPDHAHWQQQEDDIDEDVRRRGTDERLPLRQTVAFQIRMPFLLHRNASEDCKKIEGDEPAHNEKAGKPESNKIGSHNLEHSRVKEQDRELHERETGIVQYVDGEHHFGIGCRGCRSLLVLSKSDMSPINDQSAQSPHERLKTI